MLRQSPYERKQESSVSEDLLPNGANANLSDRSSVSISADGTGLLCCSDEACEEKYGLCLDDLFNLGIATELAISCGESSSFVRRDGRILSIQVHEVENRLMTLGFEGERGTFSSLSYLSASRLLTFCLAVLKTTRKIPFSTTKFSDLDIDIEVSQASITISRRRTQGA